MREKIKIQILQNMLKAVTEKYDYFISMKEEVLKETFEKAIRDPLTKLYNRHYLMERLNELISKAKRNETKFLLSFIDLNNFKQVNDTYGHEEGDKVLKQVADIIKSNFRSYDLIARYGGDEFIVVIEEDGQYFDINKVLHEINKDIEKALSKYHISISYGIATSDEENTIEKLISLADERMYENKMKMKKTHH